MSLSTAQKMIREAYIRYLDIEVDSVNFFSTLDKYTDQLTEHFKNPEQVEEPPHFQEALEKSIQKMKEKRSF